MLKMTEGRHAGEHILSEANGSRSREQIVINATAGKLDAGTILAKRSAANAASAKGVGYTGDGTFGSVTASNDAITGDYAVTITEAAADAEPSRSGTHSTTSSARAPLASSSVPAA